MSTATMLRTSSIVAMLAFGVNAVSEPMHVEGIRALEPVDHRFAERSGTESSMS